MSRIDTALQSVHWLQSRVGPSLDAPGCTSILSTDYAYRTMTNEKLLITGLVGTAVAAVCCFTPVLVVVLAGAGLSALIGYLDLVLLPLLMFFVVISVYALWRRVRGRSPSS